MVEGQQESTALQFDMHGGLIIIIVPRRMALLMVLATFSGTCFRYCLKNYQVDLEVILSKVIFTCCQYLIMNLFIRIGERNRK